MLDITSKKETRKTKILCLLHVFVYDQCRTFTGVSCFIVILPPRQTVSSDELDRDDEDNSLNTEANVESLPILVGEIPTNDLETRIPSLASTNGHVAEILTSRNQFMENTHTTSSIVPHNSGESDAEENTTTTTDSENGVDLLTNQCGMKSQEQMNASPDDRTTYSQTSLSNNMRENAPKNKGGDCPKHPLFADQSLRMDSFSSLPLHVSMMPTPWELANAGFFYVGSRDTVSCFFCGGRLFNWEPEDDPWVEHARWFSQCPFVRENKGQQFIDLVQQATQEREQQRAGSTTEERDNETNSDLSGKLLELRLSLKELEKEQVAKSPTKNIQENTITEICAMHDENKRLKENLLCKICLCNTVCIVFLPCGHICSCDDCAKFLGKCPICRKIIAGKIRTFFMNG